MSTLETVKNAIADGCDLEASDIKPSTKLVDVLDSLERVALVIELEEAFSRDIPDDDVRKLYTVQDIVTYIDSPSH